MERELANEVSAEYEVLVFKETFDLFDKDHDGRISMQELDIVMAKLGWNLTKAQIRNMFDDVDTDQSGLIDYDEFIDMLRAQALVDGDDEEYWIAFKQFDLDNDGEITMNELKSVMGTLGKELDDSEVQQMIEEADLDCNGSVNFEEFKNMVMTLCI